MWDYLKRKQLQSKGLSCGKKRREQSQSEWLETTRSSPYVRFLFLCFFLAGLGSLVRYLPPDSGYQVLHAQSLHGAPLILAILIASAAHFRVTDPQLWGRNSRVLLVYLVILIQLALVQLVDFTLRLNGKPVSSTLLYAPVALAPITLTLLLSPRAGFFACIYGSLWGGLMVHHEHGFAFLMFSLGTGLVGIMSVRHLRKRSQLMRSGLWVGLTGLAIAFVLLRMTSPFDLWRGLGWQRFGIEAGSVLLAGIFTATLVNGLLPVLEGLFKITTTISWIELSDLNHPLLKRMSLEAPGTYQHSMMVANLAEGAAEAIGADPTMCRVCSYFHDIGKLERPEYCIENINGEENPHDDLSPSMSALIIISHVKDGVDLALKHKMNREIIDVIQQHHGNSLVWYFYRRAMDHQEEVKKQVAAGLAKPTDVPEVSEKEFRYPGERPQSRESAIISLADAIEGASRVLQKPTPQKIEQLVEELVASRIKDGQLEDCDLTLGELERVKDSFKSRLRTMLHRRIPYPEDKKEKEKEREKTKEFPSEVRNAPATQKLEETNPPAARPANKPPVLVVGASVLESAEAARFGLRNAQS